MDPIQITEESTAHVVKGFRTARRELEENSKAFYDALTAMFIDAKAAAAAGGWVEEIEPSRANLERIMIEKREASQRDVQWIGGKYGELADTMHRTYEQLASNDAAQAAKLLSQIEA